MTPRSLSLIVRATVVAGTLDILAAFVMQIANKVPPLRVLQAIASGWLGPSAFGAGLPGAALGLAFHYLLIAALVVVYMLAVGDRTLALQRPLLCGVLLGVSMYVFMNAVVLPLSRIPFHPSYHLVPVLMGLAVHVLCVGIPIAYLVRSAHRIGGAQAA
jgi:hypothetical protein